MPSTLRRTRFVCVSDTHNSSPLNGSFKLPKGDVLIHAGDLTNQGSLSELRKTIDWIEEANFESKIVIAGNHDVTLDSDFCEQHGSYFHNQHPQVPQDCIQLLRDSPSITYLDHEAVVIRLIKEDGPGTSFKVFGSPYSPAQGLWAFGYSPEGASKLWEEVPLDADVVVTHTPPKYHCDESKGRGSAGCEVLRQMLWRVRPRLAVCGHIHEGRGAERIRWDLSTPNTRYKEDHTGYWTDPGSRNNKQSLVDLSVRGGEPLENNGDDGEYAIFATRSIETVHPRSKSTFKSSPAVKSPSHELSVKSPSLATAAAVHAVGSASVEHESQPQFHSVAEPSSGSATPFLPCYEKMSSATRGRGGGPPSVHCDVKALSGRLGRKETCVINAAIMASSWPHKGSGGKKYNKPIVVDIDLPVWEVNAEGEGASCE